MTKLSKATWYERVPKAELHVHLEGSIPLPALWQLVQKYGGEPSVPDMAALEKKFQFRDFPHFIETWVWKNRFLREYEDFTFIAAAVANDLVDQHVLHAEAFFSPTDFAERKLEPARLAEAIRRGLDQVPAISVLLIADLVRDHGPERGSRTLAALEGTRELGVVGIGIGGSEHRFPPAPFAEVYEHARRLGLHTSAHAGEAAGPASVWSAIDDLQVDRIGHGTSASEDPHLVMTLAERRIHVEACPISNVRTGIVDSLGCHPVRQLIDADVSVSISTDDPKMFNTSLAEELRGLHEQLGSSTVEIRSLIFQAAQNSWLPRDRKQQLVDALLGDPAWTADFPRAMVNSCV